MPSTRAGRWARNWLPRGPSRPPPRRATFDVGKHVTQRGSGTLVLRLAFSPRYKSLILPRGGLRRAVLPFGFAVPASPGRAATFPFHTHTNPSRRSTPVLFRGLRPTKRGALSVLDRSLVTLIALGRLIDTTGVKRTLEITNKRANYHVDLERASLKIYPVHI